MKYSTRFNPSLRSNKPLCQIMHDFYIKGGYLHFSHLTELKKNICITEIYMKKKSLVNKNHKIKEYIFFDGVPLKGYVAS